MSTKKRADPHILESQGVDGHRDYVTMTIADQLFGIPVLSVQDVLGRQDIAHIPLARSEVAGAINLRGRIVTVIDLRRRLGLPPRSSDIPGMSVVVEYESDSYSLMVDTVGEVLSLAAEAFERNPETMDATWKAVSDGIYRLDGQLLAILNIDRILDLRKAEAA